MFRRRNIRFRRKNSMLRIILAILAISVMILVTPFIVAYFYDFFYTLPIRIYKAPNNSFYEITVPSSHPTESNDVFKYSSLVSKSIKKNKCLKRKSARHEFVRILGKNLRQEDMTEPRYLVIGASTALGAAITRKFAYKNRPFIALGGINEIDFTTKDAFIPFENVTIKQAFIIYQPPLTRHSTTDGSAVLDEISAKYIEGLSSYFNERDIPFVFAPVAPISEETLTTALRYGACVVEVPYLVDKNAFYDLENPTIRAVRECRISGKSDIEIFSPDMMYHSIRADEASKFVRHQIKYENDLKKGRFAIYGSSNISVEKAVRLAVKAAGLEDCELTFHETPHQVSKIPETSHSALVGEENENVEKMITDEYSNFSRSEKAGVYMSIVVYGQNDNLGSASLIEKTKKFFKRINNALIEVPLANIEIIFVDYATDTKKYSLIHQKLLESFSFGPKIADKVQFIVVPRETHINLLSNVMNTSLNKASVLEYVAKNIGIQRAKGKFVMTTNIENLLSDELFELIAARQFNTAVVYRSVRFDEKEATYENFTFDQVIKILNEPWRANSFDVKQRCNIDNEDRFTIIDSKQRFIEKSSSKLKNCGVSDFLIMSKKMWDAIEGFNELPANEYIDDLFLAKLMRFVPGYAQMVTYPIMLHMKKKFIIPSTYDVVNLIDDYYCTGRCTKCPDFDENVHWGMSDKRFETYNY